LIDENPKHYKTMTDREKMIENYIEGYNQFDIYKMVADFEYHIIFKNIQNDETNMSLIGLEEFKQQAEQAKTYFTTRAMTIKSFKHLDNETETEIDYYAILAIDLPNGLKKGQELNLKGKSIFKFLGNKISELTDIS
jgi:hypothetical protein